MREKIKQEARWQIAKTLKLEYEPNVLRQHILMNSEKLQSNTESILAKLKTSETS